MVDTLGVVLIAFSWIAVAILVFFMHLIGRLYEIKFQRRSNYRLFHVPLALFLVAAAYYTVYPLVGGGLHFDFIGLILPDLLFFLAGLVLVVLSYFLLRMMIAGKG